MKKNIKRQNFTLIEMLVVIGIVGKPEVEGHDFHEWDLLRFIP